jgi:hypothetical protein
MTNTRQSNNNNPIIQNTLKNAEVSPEAENVRLLVSVFDGLQDLYDKLCKLEQGMERYLEERRNEE